MTILNTLGQVMLQQDIQGTDTRINVRSLLPGIYFVLVQGAQGSSIAKIEKQ